MRINFRMAPVPVSKPRRISEGPRHDGIIGETDPIVLSRRQKQIDYGKSLEDYQYFIKVIPNKISRPASGPWTPNKYAKYSRRSFDGQIRTWKRNIHLFRYNREHGYVGGGTSSSSISPKTTSTNTQPDKPGPSNTLPFPTPTVHQLTSCFESIQIKSEVQGILFTESEASTETEEECAMEG